MSETTLANIAIEKLGKKLYSIEHPVMGDGRYIRQASSYNSYGHILLSVYPHKGEQDILFEWKVSDQDVPNMYFPAVINGIRQIIEDHDTMRIVDLKIIACGGSFHEVDSTEKSYEEASKIAFQKH